MRDKKNSRRDFISKYAPATFFGAIGIWAVSLARFTLPTLLPQETKKIKLGPASDFPSGTIKPFERDRVIIFSDDEGIYAISTTCTHLGCVVIWNGREFECPCHGSRFANNGKVTKGPAPKGLNWHKIVELPSGQIEVDLNSYVKPGTRGALHA